MKKIIMTGTLAALLTFGGLLVPALAGPVDVVVEVVDELARGKKLSSILRN